MKKSLPGLHKSRPVSLSRAVSLDRDRLIDQLLAHDPSTSRSGLDLELGDLDTAATKVRGLLTCLPSSLEEIKRRTSPCSVFSIRSALFALVDQDRLTTEQADQLAPLSRVVGLGHIEKLLLERFDQARSSMTLSLSSPKHKLIRIERLLALLFHSPRGQAVFEALTGEERVLLSGPWVRPMMRLAHQELFPRHALVALFRSTKDEDRELLLEQFERCRRRVGSAALSVYQLLFEHLDPIELELLFGHFAANGELESLRAHLSNFGPAVRRAYDQATRSVSEVS